MKNRNKYLKFESSFKDILTTIFINNWFYKLSAIILAILIWVLLGYCN